ncbi:MAG: hypothetical protein AB9866_08240 [Syntrophobacteraceae bacterium]
MGNEKFVRQEIPVELAKVRADFTKLIAAYPNYFGNLKGAGFPKAKYPLQSSTLYENLGCLGLQPEFDLLKAVLYINQDTGYLGGLCTRGSQEFVRFYLSFDNGETWQDQGVTSITVYDVKHEGQIEYAVEMPIKVRKLPCRKPNLIMARAILSWNVAPPPDTPDYAPVWGNRVDSIVMVRPVDWILLKELVISEVMKELGSVVDLDQAICLQKEPVEPAGLVAFYQKAKVELHRAVFPFVQQSLEKPAMLSTLQASPLLAASKLKVDLSKIIEALLKTDSDISYEELNCIGLQPRDSLDHLVGVLKIKKPLGYSGNLCSDGSLEYVRFYMDFGAGWEDMGLTSVRVYDIGQISRKGLDYAVFLPVDLSKHRKSCRKGPVLVKMRAILSWNAAPPPNTPLYKPVWGNAEETLVLLTPGKESIGDKPAPVITAVCGQSVDDIDPVTGLINNAGFHDAPFGNSLWISGHIGNAPDISSGLAKLKYRLLAGTDGVNFNPVTTAFRISREQLSGGVWSFPPPVTQTPPADGYAEYQEDLAGPVQIFVNLDILGVLNTVGDSSPYRWLRVEVKDPLNPAVTYTSDVVKVCVDNTAPTAEITMNQGPCSDIKMGDTISGTYTTADGHFGSVSIYTLGGAGTVDKTPSAGPAATGESGTWSLDTGDMPPCGYVIQLQSVDRTLIGYASGTAYSTSVGHYFYPTALGFCLKKLTAEQAG